MNTSILHICRINHQQIFVDGEPVFSTENQEINGFLKAAFQHLQLDYPKFYKMDNLAKLAFLGVEYILQKNTCIFGEENLALNFVNAHSSGDTDWKHQQLLNANKMVSPAVFVYTLPNILMGELAIKHKWYGENLFKLAPTFSVSEWMRDTEQLFALNKAEFCLGGWVELVEEKHELTLFLVAKEGAKNALTESEIKTILNSEYGT